MGDKNKKLFEVLGISEMHKRGWKGQGVRVLIDESSTTSEHSKKTHDTIKRIAPLSKIVHYDAPKSAPSANALNRHRWNAYKDYDIVNRSMTGENDMSKESRDARRKLYEGGTLLVSAAGNSDYVLSADIADPSVIAVDDLAMNQEDGRMVIASGFAPDPHGYRDFCMPAGCYTDHGYYSGSSGAAAVMSGIIALVISAYKAERMPYFSDDILEDLKAFASTVVYEGHDINRNGVHTADIKGGLVDPAKVASGWVSLKGFEPLRRRPALQLTLGSKVIKTDKGDIEMDIIPIVQNGRMLVPIRFVCDALDMTVEWDQKTKTATMTAKRRGR